MGKRAVEAEEIRPALAGQPGVAERLLRRVRVVLEVAAPVRDPTGERVPDVHEPGVILGLLEQRQRLSHERLQLVDGRIGRKEHAVVGGTDTRERLACFVACRPCPLGGGVGNRCGLRAVPEERLGEVELEHDVQARRPGQLERTLEQTGGGAFVAAPERAAAGGREPLARAFGE